MKNPLCKTWSAAILLLTVILLPGCDSRSRHKTLNFFFTGAPPLEENVAKKEEKTEQNKTDKKYQVAAAEIVSAHSYFRQKKCSKCHRRTMPIVSGRTSKMSREPAPDSGKPPDSPLIQELGICLNCHKNPFEAKKSYVLQTHAPVRCSVCHAPHQSEYPYLLISDASKICSMCHTDEKRSGKGFHEAPLKSDYSE